MRSIPKDPTALAQAVNTTNSARPIAEAPWLYSCSHLLAKGEDIGDRMLERARVMTVASQNEDEAGVAVLVSLGKVPVIHEALG
jgi:hypothetical protein